jgi:hypothetical protein
LAGQPGGEYVTARHGYKSYSPFAAFNMLKSSGRTATRIATTGGFALGKNWGKQ